MALEWSSLWSQDPLIRLPAISDFVLSLETLPRPSTSSSLLEDLHPDVVYALKRLIRGLASPREAARIGFATALTELLARLPQCPISAIIDILLDKTAVTHSTKGEEGRDKHFGRLVGVESLVASGLLSTRGVTEDDLRKICRSLIGLYDAKSYLRESIGVLSFNMIRALPQWRTVICDILLAPARELTPEALAWSIAAGIPVFDDPHIDDAVRVLKVTHSLRGPQGEAHFVWSVIANSGPSASLADRLTRQLLTRDATPTQRREGILASKELMTVPTQLTRALFRFAVEGSIKGRNSTPDRQLAASKLLSRVEELLSLYPQSTLGLLTTLIGEDGSGYFPSLNQSKSLHGLATRLPAENRDQWLSILHTIFTLPCVEDADLEERKRSATHMRRWIIELVATSKAHHAVDLLCIHGFFDVSKEHKKPRLGVTCRLPVPPLTDVLHQMCRSQLYNMLCKNTEHMSQAIATLEILCSDGKHFEPVSEMVAAGEAMRSNALSLASALSQENNGQKALSRLLRCMYIVSFEGAADLGAVEVLVELAQQLLDDSSSAIMNELAAQMIALLQTPNPLVRSAVEDVFSAFVHEMREASVDLLIEMIAPNVLEEDGMSGETRRVAYVDDRNGQKVSDGDSSSLHDTEESTGELVFSGDDEDIVLHLDPVDGQLRNKVEAALKEANIADGDSDGEMDEETLLDDEHMFALDEQLAAAFRSERRRPSKQTSQVQDVQAQLKILDLLHLYAKTSPASPLIPKVVATLHAASLDANLRAKAIRLLKLLISRSHTPTDDALLSMNAQKVLPRILSKPSSSKPIAAIYLLQIISSTQAACEALSSSVKAFVVQKRPPLTEAALIALIKARPAAFAGYISTFTAAATDHTDRPMRRRQCARVSANLLQALVPSAPSVVVTHLPATAFALAATVDASGSADAAREQLKALASLLRLARNASKLQIGQPELDAICAKGKLQTQVYTPDAFGGSKPCHSLARDIQLLTDAPSVAALNGHALAKRTNNTAKDTRAAKKRRL